MIHIEINKKLHGSDGEMDLDVNLTINEGDFALLEKTNEILENLLGTDEEDPDPSDLYNLIYYK